MFTLLLLLASCGGGRGNSISGVAGDTLRFRYACHISWVSYPHYSVVTLSNPWRKGGLLHTYVVVPRDSALPANLPSGTLLRTPLKRLFVTATVHANLIKWLGCVDVIKAVSDLKYMNIPEIQQGVSRGLIIDAGEGLNPDVERIVEAKPEALFLMPFENGGYGQMEKLGAPLVECAEYMEPAPLGEAEWMRFYGRLLGRGDAADSLFAVVEKNYLHDKALADTVKQRPTLLCELKTGSAWYVPGGKSTMGQLYRDAGARYLLGDNSNTGSVPLSFETIFSKGEKADMWLIKYHAPVDKSYRSLAAENRLYTRFAAFAHRSIWGCNLSVKPFYEETPFRPDYLLHDLIAIFHPQIISPDSLRYYSKMNE